MSRYILGRLLATPLLVLGIVTAAFFTSHLSRGDPLTAIVSDHEMDNPEIVAAERFPATLELVLVAMVWGSIGGVTLGVLAAAYRNSIIDHVARLFALFGSALPVFWSGLLLLLVFSVQLGLLPGPGRLDTRAVARPHLSGMYLLDALIAGDFAAFRNTAYHIVLPSFVLGWTVIGIVSRLVRASMLDVLGQDYLRTARAKGVTERRVMFFHALRDTLIPTLTIIGHSFAYLLTGAVLTETVFSWPGIGSYAVSAARSLDYPAIIGVTIVGGLAFLVTNLVTDVAYAVANPKIRLS